ncbi:FKBP-type peptidyl-prolyl cis-trans isomerase [Hymenobacter cellulosilyticus]|uniref:Peptidyl-prolyl cis-trans isomerase n=1 Tax=Hymenobacter cellulosilyticus TaxID=2932248 RepID=A0A8T9Q8S9_9BACT|nr:FKBP-type peptidyl-prolyl cis-trans isomerase [Hymenobacter cellulosilyticus]UOQ73946.1 FKBP-type peptidyl-prolyl cis-trans isomerase [Hymenobacter cellulosilyticus]
MKTMFPRSIVTRLAVWLLLAAPLLLASCNTDSDAVKAAKAHEEEFRKVDDALIQAYFTRHNISSSNYQRTESGLYLVKIKDGSGELIKPGNKVQVKYIGSYIREAYEDQIFDKSYGNRTLCECTEVVVGQGQVIRGWEEALKLMRPGDQKQVFIPSYLAYGQYGSNSIPGMSRCSSIWKSSRFSKPGACTASGFFPRA